MTDRGTRLKAGATLALACAWTQPVTAQDRPVTTLPEVQVLGTRQDLQGVATSASEGIVTARQLRTRPLLRAGDIMEAVPGLVATQNAGEGKANQYFLRGFNLDHGTDFATLTANWRPAPGWDVDADLSLARPRFTDGDPAGDRIPGAMERVATVGLSYTNGAWSAGARVRHFGDHALIEDNSLRGRASTLANVRLAYRIAPQAEISLDVFNLFDREVDDIQYAYASRLPGEPAFGDATTPPTLHVHPSAPRMARVGLKVFF